METLTKMLALCGGGSKDKLGYGRVGNAKKKTLVHRMAYKMYHGALDDNQVVLHLCDNPSCINPLHLRASFGVRGE